jgi:hypothetical protein
MSEMLTAMGELADAMEESCGETVTFSRSDDGAQLSITAVRGRNTHERWSMADGRAILEEEPQDWLVKPSALDFGAGEYTPRKGDRFEDAAGRVYECLPRSDEPAVRFSGSYPTMLRVRTIRVT